MNIEGMYCSEKGSELARKTMKLFKKAEPDKNDRFCSCGGMLHSNPKYRDGVPVCDGCAEIISRKKKENPVRVYHVTNECAVCGGLFPMRLISIRNKVKYCKDHVPNTRIKLAHTFKCSHCGEFQPLRKMLRRHGDFYCEVCASVAPKGRLQPCTTKCSACGEFVTRKKLFMRKGVLFCEKCLSNK